MAISFAAVRVRLRPRQGARSASTGLLAGRESLAAHAGTAGMKDVDILNVALGLEHEAIGAYQLGAQSGLLKKPVLDVAVLFQSHHKRHRDALVATIEKLGGPPVIEKSLDDYARALQAGTLKSQADVLSLAARLELGATNAYLGVIPSFGDSALAKVAARLAADETMHWTALASALARSLPTEALSFGACAEPCAGAPLPRCWRPCSPAARRPRRATRRAGRRCTSSATSPAMRKTRTASGRRIAVWSAASLERWLADPEGLVPGQRIYYAVANARDRADLIAYLRSLSTP
jgi:rubrerythrin